MSIKTLSKKMLAIVAAGAMTLGLVMPTSVFAAEGDTAKKKERGEHLCSLQIQRIMQSGLSVIWQ